MTAEQRWRRAMEDEEAEPSDWHPDLVALSQRLRAAAPEPVDGRDWWSIEVALLLRQA